MPRVAHPLVVENNFQHSFAVDALEGTDCVDVDGDKFVRIRFNLGLDALYGKL